MLPVVEISGAFVIGIGLGWSLQRGGFCMNTAFRSILFERDKSLLRAWLLVVLINLVGVQLLAGLGVLRPTETPFFWPALVVGGVIFGLGMVGAGGCASGTYYRAGRGMLGSWGALVGFLLGTAALDGGALAGIQVALRTPRWEHRGGIPTLFSVTSLDGPVLRWVVIAAVSIPVLMYLLRAPKQKFVFGWGWKRTGFIIGFIALATWVFSSFTGRDFGLSITQPSAALTRLLIAGDATGIGVPTYMLIGLPLGAFLSALVRSEAGWVLPDAKTLVRQTTGGLIMGVGAGIAGGCNIGHGVTGIATLSLGSILGVFSIMGGCWIMTAIVRRSQQALMRAQI